jgi:hypothetical protein
LAPVSTRIDDEWFGMSFPSKCDDGYAYAGTDLRKLREAMKGYGVLWPADADRNDPPDDGVVFDLLEFAYELIAEAQDQYSTALWAVRITATTATRAASGAPMT